MTDLIVYKKIELLKKIKLSDGKDHRFNSSEKIEYENSVLTLSGNYLIISTFDNDTNNSIIQSNIIYPLDTIVTYRTTL